MVPPSFETVRGWQNHGLGRWRRRVADGSTTYVRRCGCARCARCREASRCRTEGLEFRVVTRAPTAVWCRPAPSTFDLPMLLRRRRRGGVAVASEKRQKAWGGRLAPVARTGGPSAIERMERAGASPYAV